MVRFMNRTLKAHSYSGKEKILDVMGASSLIKFSQLLEEHVKNFREISSSDYHEMFNKLSINVSLNHPADFYNLYRTNFSLKKVILCIEIILDTYYNNQWDEGKYFDDFVEDINDFFLIERVPLQIRVIKEKSEFYVEKIISPEISEKIKETLENFSEEDKVFEDFKEAIKRYSSGDFEGSIEKCCVSLEDFFCVILEKGKCPSVETYYKAVSKKLSIPQDLDNRFNNLITYIHNHRSAPKHGSLKKKKVEDIELVNEVIIQFTMVILNYVKKK